MLKFAIITDVHVGQAEPFEGVDRKLTQYALPAIESFCQTVSDDPDYAFAIQLGDLIEDHSKAVDIENYRRAVNMFRQQLNKPMYHVIGNHDTVNLTPEMRGDILQSQDTYYSFSYGDYCFIVLHTTVPRYAERPIAIPNLQKQWLKETLSQMDKPVVIFTHHPLADQDLCANPWFYDLEEDCLVKNRVELRKIIKESKKVVAVINGHVHWNRIDIHDGIPYITIQSSTENFKNDGTPAQAWAEVSLTDTLIDIEVHGNDTMRLSYPIDNWSRRSQPENILESAETI